MPPSPRTLFTRRPIPRRLRGPAVAATVSVVIADALIVCCGVALIVQGLPSQAPSVAASDIAATHTLTWLWAGGMIVGAVMNTIGIVWQVLAFELAGTVLVAGGLVTWVFAIVQDNRLSSTAAAFLFAALAAHLAYRASVAWASQILAYDEPHVLPEPPQLTKEVIADVARGARRELRRRRRRKAD